MGMARLANPEVQLYRWLKELQQWLSHKSSSFQGPVSVRMGVSTTAHKPYSGYRGRVHIIIFLHLRYSGKLSLRLRFSSQVLCYPPPKKSIFFFQLSSFLMKNDIGTGPSRVSRVHWVDGICSYVHSQLSRPDSECQVLSRYLVSEAEVTDGKEDTI